MITLEQLLKTKCITEFRVSVQKTFDRGVLFIIHPQDTDGDTLDFMVSDNLLTDPKGGRLKRLTRDHATRTKNREKVTITSDDIGILKL